MRPVSKPNNDPLTAALGKLVGAHVAETHISEAWHVPFDVKETPTEVTVFIDMPGVDEDEISIKVVGNELRVRADRDFDHDGEDAEEYTRLERPYGVFECTASLPVGSDSDGMTAKYKRGVLKVRIPVRH